MSQTVEMLVGRVQHGDEDALLTLHSRYASLVYAVAYRILDDPMAAEEVTQDTFLRLWEKADTFDPAKGRFIPWLLTVARRQAIDVFRQRRRREPQTGLFFLDEQPQLWEQLPDDVDGGDRDLRHGLRSALQQLPPEQRTVIELAYFYGMTHSDIAAYLHEPLGTIKTRLRLGMEKLRQAWLQEPPPHAETDSEA